MIFLKYMRDRDNDVSHFEVGAKHAIAIAAEVGDLLGVSKNSLYRAYSEWKAGEVSSDDDGHTRPGAFCAPKRGTYEKRFLLNE